MSEVLNLVVSGNLQVNVCELCAVLYSYVVWCGSLKMEPTGCPETSLKSYRYTLRDYTAESSSHLRRGRNLNT
jgi:hypothetical protein